MYQKTKEIVFQIKDRIKVKNIKILYKSNIIKKRTPLFNVSFATSFFKSRLSYPYTHQVFFSKVFQKRVLNLLHVFYW